LKFEAIIAYPVSYLLDSLLSFYINKALD